MPGCLSSAHPFRDGQTNLQIKFHGVDPLSLLRSLQKENRWPDFTPPADGLFRRFRGRLLHHRSHHIPAPKNHALQRPTKQLDRLQDAIAASKRRLRDLVLSQFLNGY